MLLKFGLSAMLILPMNVAATEAPAPAESEDMMLTLPDVAPLPTPRPDRTQLDERIVFLKAVSQGVPRRPLEDLLKFRRNNMNREFQQDVYRCNGFSEDSVKPCAEKDRSRATKTVKLEAHPYAVIIDYGKPSTEERMFIIHFETGKVSKMLVAHGQGSGNGRVAYRFSNIKDSRQTSLGMYLTGEVYSGNYGPTLRMYGLEKSNDQAYHRDIVLHGAWYADPSFIQSENYKTKKPYGRLGVSWGCPAISTSLQTRWYPALQGGALIYHYHEELQSKAQLTGHEVRTESLPEEYVPLPTPRPEPVEEKPEETPAPELNSETRS